MAAIYKKVRPFPAGTRPSPPRLGALVLAVGMAVAARAEEKVNYTEHVLPLVEANCSKCHNSDKKKADLDLTSYAGALKGSGSGVVLISGNPDASKLWRSLTHAEEPFMPPNRPKLGDKELEVFRKWITSGLLETAGGTAVASAAKPGLELDLKPGDVARPEGPPPMPGPLPVTSVVHTPRMNAVTGLAASPWAPLLAVAGQRQILLYNSDTLALLGILPFPEGEPVSVKFSANGKFLVGAGGRAAKSGKVYLWEISSGKLAATLGQEYDSVLAADLRADLSQVALGGSSRLVKIYSTRTGELVRKIKKHTDWVTAVAYSPNGQMVASADRNGGVSVWEAESGQELFTLAGHKAAVTALSWRPDSKLVASSSEDGTVKLWELREGKEVKSWKAHEGGALCVAYGADGRLVSCGRDNGVTLWEATGGKKKQFDFGGTLPLRACVAYDGKRVFASDFSGRIGAWTVEDAKLLGELDANPGGTKTAGDAAQAPVPVKVKGKAPAGSPGVAGKLASRSGL